MVTQTEPKVETNVRSLVLFFEAGLSGFAFATYV